MIRIGVDIGGTFTDLVAVDASGDIYLAKTPSTPKDPSQGVMLGLGLLGERMGLSLDDLLGAAELFIHGTTVATNTLIERTGASLGLLTTAGFRDLLELREGTKPNRYALREPFPDPLIPRRLRLEVPERIRYDGTVETSLDSESATESLKTLSDADVQGLVVCFINAHRNGDHEAKIRELAQSIGWDTYISLSHEVLPREGEYDRLCTAAVNAYVGPRLSRYLGRLADRLREAGGKFTLLIMQSSGGVLPAEEAANYAVGTIQSGPAGGATACALYARSADFPRLVTFDMGGTSSDIALIVDGAPLERQVTPFDTLKIAAPAVDIVNLGAGGGSLAWLDAGGVLQLGPESAGAEPGPACYQRGGERPTVTDANLVLGYISPDTFLGGAMSLSVDLARKVIQTHLAEPLGLTVEDAARAVHALANTLIAEGIRAATVRRGLDPRDFALLGFGGAAGLHTASVADELSIPRAVIPSRASVWSALGFLSADVRHDIVRSVGGAIGNYDAAWLRDAFGAMEEEARKRLAAEGFAPSEMRFLRFADCRYVRQVYALPTTIEAEDLARPALDWLVSRFEGVYEARYYHVHHAEPIHIDNIRLVGYGELPSLALPTQPEGGTDSSAAQRGTRSIHIDDWVEAGVYWFDDFRPGMKIAGPAVIDSATTSILLPAHHMATVDRFQSLIITPGDAS